jgi:DNA polymerase I-like protein with 3'-5' exonuclease and polymerase domains
MTELRQVGVSELFEIHEIYDAEDEVAYPSQVLPDPELVEWTVAYDTEASGLHEDDGARVSVISLAYKLDGVVHAFAWPFGQGPDGSEKFTIPADHKDYDRMTARMDIGSGEWRWLGNWLASQKVLIGHNIKYDTHMMLAGGINGQPGIDLRHNSWWDTMVGAKELWPQFRLALKPLAVRFFQEDADAEQRALQPYLGPKADARYDRVPWPVMQPYAIKDALYTFLVFEMQQWRASEGYDGSQWIGREIKVMHALLGMELAGIPYSAQYSRDIADKLAERQTALLATIPFLPKDAKKWYFTDKLPGSLNKRPLKKTAPTKSFPEGQAQLTADIVQRMASIGEDTWPHAQALFDVNKIATALKMWYRPYADRTNSNDSRLRCVFRHVASEQGQQKEAGTRSGRFSVERVNLQAIPQDYRVQIGVPTPRTVVGYAVEQIPGWSLWELDLAQAELRVAAMWAGCEKMLSAIAEKRDLHGETCAELFNLTPDSPDWGQYRQLAKRSNFSLIFGSGPVTFREAMAKEGTYLSLGESKDIVYGWRDLYPEFSEAIDWHQDFAAENGYVVLANGRYRRFTEGEQQHKAFNQRVQGSIAELGKDWLVDSDAKLKHFRQQGLDAGIGRGGLILVIHDSQVLLLPDGEADQYVTSTTQAGIRFWDRMFPGVPGEIEAKQWGAH